jgi:hypothetical protein
MPWEAASQSSARAKADILFAKGRFASPRERFTIKTSGATGGALLSPTFNRLIARTSRSTMS